MRKIRIVIVDSGVRLDHPAVQDHHPVVVRYSGLREGEGDCGHGTAIYNIVKKTESFADIINFQITNKDGEICEETLKLLMSKRLDFLWKNQYMTDSDYYKLKTAYDDVVKFSLITRNKYLKDQIRSSVSSQKSLKERILEVQEKDRVWMENLIKALNR